MGNNYKTRIVIVDDHPLMRRGLTLTLESELSFEVVAQLSSGEEMLEKLDELKPDVIIVDVSLPGMNGLETIKNVVARNQDQKILVVSRHDEALYAERVIRAGAKGYVMKMEASNILKKAIKKILNGGIYVSQKLNERLLLGMASGQKEIEKPPIEKLSDRELEVYELTGKGNTTREIADQLHLSVKTVESYRARIKTKLTLQNSTELMVHAVKWAEA